jgi:hypothetical protein
MYIVDKYTPGTRHACYYDSRDKHTIWWSIAYNVGYWIGTTIFAFIALVCLVILSHPLMALVGDSVPQWFFQTTFVASWISVLIPFCLFLPLYHAAPISKEGRVTQLVLFYQFLTLGFFPFVVCRWDALVSAAYTVCVWGLLGWATPFLAWYKDVTLALLSGWLGCAGFVGFVGFVHWNRQRLERRIHTTPVSPNQPSAVVLSQVSIQPVIVMQIPDQPPVMQHTECPTYVYRYPHNQDCTTESAPAYEQHTSAAPPTYEQHTSTAPPTYEQHTSTAPPAYV